MFSSLDQLVKVSAVDVEVPNVLSIHVHTMLVQYDEFVIFLIFLIFFLVWLRINPKTLLSQIACKTVLLDRQSCHPGLQNEKVICLWSFDLFLCVHTL